MRLIDADELIVMEYGGIKFVPKEFIDDAPTIEKRKTGRWIAHDSSIKDVPTECCSECCQWSYGWYENYCPNCGAKMDGERKEE